MSEENVSTQGHKCVICKGYHKFPSDDARGLYPDRELYPDVFICWECVHFLHKIFNSKISNNSYTFLFVKREED